jgi:hypothetical protein
MAELMMNGIKHTVPEMNFVAVERAWPYMVDAMGSQDPIKGASAAVAVIAAGLMEMDSFKEADYGITNDMISTTEERDPQVHRLVQMYMKRKLKASEMGLVTLCVITMVQEAGLSPAEGEPRPPLVDPKLTENLLTEMSTESSQSSLPLELKEAAGTA